ncbi:MAG TPA: anti-sigma factor [Cyclobacteriaceae bacterium]|nr:anti-sigma factor [Cyclobacteriaceae bacterium]
MNVKEYISSGILESYASGELSESERADVERNLAQYPELRKELSLIEETMEAFFLKAAKEPRAAVKTRILEAITLRSVQSVVSREQRPTNNEPKSNVIAFWKYATAASIVLAFTSTFMAYNFWNNWKETEVSLLQLRAVNEQVARDYDQVNQRLDAIENEMKIVSSPSFARVVMKGTANSPDAMASVYWNKSTQESYLSIQNLKALAQEQQYQLWAIVDGKPIDMGVFDSATGLHKMKSVGNVAAFAVTIEPRGGKPSPSMATMQVLGNT